MSNTTNKKQTKFNNKDLKFHVGDIIYQVVKEDGSDYSIETIRIDKFEIDKVVVRKGGIEYSTTTECSFYDNENTQQSNLFHKTLSSALKAFDALVKEAFIDKIK